MKPDSIKTYITPRTTGYAALAGFGLTAISALNKRKIKTLHKPLACITAGIAAAHVGLIEYYNYKYKQKY